MGSFYFLAEKAPVVGSLPLRVLKLQWLERSAQVCPKFGVQPQWGGCAGPARLQSITNPESSGTGSWVGDQLLNSRSRKLGRCPGLLAIQIVMLKAAYCD